MKVCEELYTKILAYEEKKNSCLYLLVSNVLDIKSKFLEEVLENYVSAMSLYVCPSVSYLPLGVPLPKTIEILTKKTYYQCLYFAYPFVALVT